MSQNFPLKKYLDSEIMDESKAQHIIMQTRKWQNLLMRHCGKS
jgi:hypothetical protein